MTEPINVQAGVRSLPPDGLVSSIPTRIAGPLLDLGRACNDAGGMVATADLELRRVRDTCQRLDQLGQRRTSVEMRTVELLLDAATSHVERVASVYAAVTARYVTAAAEAASHAISGREVTVPDVDSVDIADVVLLAEIHVPLLQFDEAALSDPRRARVENMGLRATHEVVQQVLAQTVRYDRTDAHDQVHRFAPSPELGGALHEYATDCVAALAMALANGQTEA